jgi:tripeptide aminopeptidase
VSLALNVNIAEREGRIYSSGSTALGGDDRTGVAALLTIIREIVVNRLSHPPLTFLFTISEESAPNGSQFVSPNDLENPVEGYNFDGADPIYLITGAIGIINFQVEVHGKATHAGVNPEGGISATLVAASALSALYEEGWCGAINQDGKSGSANVGLLCGALDGAVGGDVNVVTDYIKISGEARSYDLVFLERIALKYQEAFRLACKRIKNAQREEATFSFSHETVMVPFRLPEDAPVVKRASRLAEAIGIGKPHSKVIRGGLDANWFNALGIPTITLGAGQHEVHTLNEYIEISEFLNGCKLGLAIATDLN